MNFLIGLGGVILGIATTLFVARYYYKRSIYKRLNIYVHFSTSILDGIDSSTRSDINVSYRGTTIDDLFQLQFFVANEGNRPIRDLLEPLSLRLPDRVRVLDASIIYVNPSGRKISINRDLAENSSNLIIFDIPLLNAGDFFLTKILLKDAINARDLQFNIAVDDLPPIIKPQPLPFHGIRKSWHSPTFTWFSIAVGLLYLLIALSLVKIILMTLINYSIQFTAFNLIVLLLTGLGVITTLLKAWEHFVTFGLSHFFNKPLFDLPETITSWQWEIMQSVEREKKFQSYKKTK